MTAPPGSALAVCQKKGHAWRDEDAQESDCMRCGLLRIFQGLSPRGKPTWRYVRQREWRRGTRVRLVFIGDDEPLEPGITGTVAGVSAEGVPVIDWDTGVRLGVIPRFDVIEEAGGATQAAS